MNYKNYVNYGQHSFNPYPLAPAMDEDLPDPSSYPYQQLPVQQSMIQQPLAVYYPQNTPVIAPVLSQDEVVAHQAYHALYHSDLKVAANLPSLNDLDKTSIETLKQIEQRSNQGFFNGFLAVTIKVLQVVGKLPLGIVVGFSTALVISTLLGLPNAAALVLLAAASPGMVTLILGGMVCKVSALVLQSLRKKWIEHSFHSAIQTKQTEVQNLKSWIQVQNLSEMEGRIGDAIGKIKLAQQARYDFLRGDQLIYLNELMINIQHFRGIEQELDLENSMPLLNRYLVN